MFEHHRQPLIPRRAFLLRQARHAGFALLLVLVALSLGVIGYRVTEGMDWVDALANAALILGGMGPLMELETDAGKIFLSAYALFSGLLFLVVVGVFFAPVVHRFLHRLHVAVDDDEPPSS